MKNDIPQALQALKPGAQWVLRGTEYSGLEWLDSGQQPTEQEVKAKIIELDAAEPMKLLRIERDKKIALTDWRVLPDQTPSDDWINYRQALRDLPASASPKLDSNYELDFSSFTWPTEPE
jgi:hypothetical protein|tara:strand:- start:1112 stop:1471 length:360 start_codon:yes stop_codon:yes gene_type:complete